MKIEINLISSSKNSLFHWTVFQPIEIACSKVQTVVRIKWMGREKKNTNGFIALSQLADSSMKIETTLSQSQCWWKYSKHVLYWTSLEWTPWHVTRQRRNFMSTVAVIRLIKFNSVAIFRADFTRIMWNKRNADVGRQKKEQNEVANGTR